MTAPPDARPSPCHDVCEHVRYATAEPLTTAQRFAGATWACGYQRGWDDRDAHGCEHGLAPLFTGLVVGAVVTLVTAGAMLAALWGMGS